jgi:hypothetical protein
VQALQQAQQQWRSTADNIAGHFSSTRLATAAILLVIFLGCFGLAALPASPSSTNRGSASGWYSGNATAGYCAAKDTSSQLEAAVLQHSTGGHVCLAGAATSTNAGAVPTSALPLSLRGYMHGVCSAAHNSTA